MNSPPYNPSSIGQAEKFVCTLKNALKMSNRAVPFQPFLQKVLLNPAKPSGGCPLSTDIMMWHRRLRHPLTMSESVGAPIWMRNHVDSDPKKASFVSQHGQNTALIFVENQGLRLAHQNQWTPRMEPELRSDSSTCEGTVPVTHETSGAMKTVLTTETGATNGDYDVLIPDTRAAEADRASSVTGARGRYNLRNIPRQCYKV